MSTFSEVMVGRGLKALRARRGLRLAEVATRAGMSPSALSRLEAGKVDPKFSTVCHLLRALDAGLPEFDEELKSALRK